MKKFSKASQNRLATANEPLPALFEKALSVSPIDFGIARGKATAQEQFELYKKGRKEVNGKWKIENKAQIVTYCDGFNKKSNHQSGNAIDIYAYVNGKASWDEIHLAIVAGVVLSVANKMGINIKWGGTFGSNKFKGWDMPHFELIT